MADKNPANPVEIGHQMDHVSNANDANKVANELRHAIDGMSSAEALSFVREVRRNTSDKPGQGETIAITTDMTHASVYLNNPYTPQTKIDLPSVLKPDGVVHAAHSQADKPAGLTPEKVASDMDAVRNSSEATSALQELERAVDGMNLHDTVSFIGNVSRADKKNDGADVALVVGPNGEPQISFTSPYQPEVIATITDDSKAKAQSEFSKVISSEN